MSRRYFFLMAAFVSSILTLPLMGADELTETTTAEPSIGRYELKKRSSFKTGQNPRPPFWPIGHVKMNRNMMTAAPVQMSKLDPSMFSITSIVLGNQSLAVINGRAYGEGEYLRPAKGAAVKTVDARNRIRVTRILDGMVTLQSTDGQSVVVPLRRPELNEKRPEAEEQLLLGEQ